jgi:septal ring factor EnvC (AmiA/AmiB activator)
MDAIVNIINALGVLAQNPVSFLLLCGFIVIGIGQVAIKKEDAVTEERKALARITDRDSARLAALEVEVRSLHAQFSVAQEEKAEAELNLITTRTELKQVEADRDRLQLRVNKLEQRVSELEAENAALRKKLEELERKAVS